MNQVHVSKPSSNAAKTFVMTNANDLGGMVTDCTDKGAVFTFGSAADAAEFARRVNKTFAAIKADIL
jgi:hypothetical protein